MAIRLGGNWRAGVKRVRGRRVADLTLSDEGVAMLGNLVAALGGREEVTLAMDAAEAARVEEAVRLGNVLGVVHVMMLGAGDLVEPREQFRGEHWDAGVGVSRETLQQAALEEQAHLAAGLEAALRIMAQVPGPVRAYRPGIDPWEEQDRAEGGEAGVGAEVGAEARFGRPDDHAVPGQVQVPSVFVEPEKDWREFAGKFTRDDLPEGWKVADGSEVPAPPRISAHMHPVRDTFTRIGTLPDDGGVLLREDATGETWVARKVVTG